jgi:hypothetical protein
MLKKFCPTINGRLFRGGERARLLHHLQREININLSPLKKINKTNLRDRLWLSLLIVAGAAFAVSLLADFALFRLLFQSLLLLLSLGQFNAT